MPLIWANKMANDLNTLSTFTNHAKVRDIKEGITTTLRRFAKDLETLNSYNEYRIPHSIIQILIIALYFFLVLSAVSSHDIPNETNVNSWERVLNFPVFALMKYILLFGWLNSAAGLQLSLIHI